VFTELGQNMQTVSANDDVSRSIDLDAGEHGAVVKTNTSTLSISGGGIDETISIGAIEYEGEDGTKIAYQGGTVFHETGDETSVVSSSPVYFDAERESLTFPVVKAKDEAKLDSGDVTITHSGETDPLREANIVRDETVTIEVESEYCRGWEQYLKEEAGNVAVKYGCYDNENEEGPVTVQLGHTDLSAAFNSGVSIADVDNYEEQTSGGELSDVSSNAFLPLDDVIEELVVDFEKDESHVGDGGSVTLGSGNHFVSAGTFDDTDELVFDLEDGDVMIVVDDDIAGYDVTVESCGNDGKHQAKMYATGNLDVDTNEFRQKCGADESNLQVFGDSETGIDFGNGHFEGLTYAASDRDPDRTFEGWEVNQNNDEQYQAHLQGSPEFDGSLVVHSVAEHSNFNNRDDFNTHSIDSDVKIIPEGYEPAPQLTYLNVAEHRLEIEQN
jgi:hypothetical protein